MQQLALDLEPTRAPRRLDPRATVRDWADQAKDLRRLALILGTQGWTEARLSADGRQLDIRGPSGIHISLWDGLERSVIIVQLSLAWLGPLGVMTEEK
jgi:hypothetical protein